MTLKNMIGLEAEYFLLKDKNEVIIVPSSWDRDDFPILGEIRGEPGETMADVVASFIKAQMIVTSKLQKEHQIKAVDMQRIPLKVYQKAMKEMTIPKNEFLGKTYNIYGIDIDEFSDQIVEKGKIQGVNASCGLHIHFSSSISATLKRITKKYSSVHLPIAIGTSDNSKLQPYLDLYKIAIGTSDNSKLQPCLDLYKYDGCDTKEVETVTVSQLTQPVIEWIVKKMDEKFFDTLAPEKKNRTKFRQPGFYRLKPYGFEYRSLPANEKTLATLPEITNYAFELLQSLKVSFPKT